LSESKLKFTRVRNKFDDLRNRPFLVVTSIERPVTGVNTSEAKWNKMTGSINLFERAEIVDRVKTTLLQKATVVIDLIGGKIIKSRYDLDDQQVVEHYLGKYMDECKRGVDTWLTRQGRDFVTREKAAKLVAANMAVNEINETEPE
jgi:hypothetical protein